MQWFLHRVPYSFRDSSERNTSESDELFLRFPDSPRLANDSVS